MGLLFAIPVFAFYQIEELRLHVNSVTTAELISQLGMYLGLPLFSLVLMLVRQIFFFFTFIFLSVVLVSQLKLNPLSQAPVADLFLFGLTVLSYAMIFRRDFVYPFLGAGQRGWRQFTRKTLDKECQLKFANQTSAVVIRDMSLNGLRLHVTDSETFANLASVSGKVEMALLIEGKTFELSLEVTRADQERNEVSLNAINLARMDQILGHLGPNFVYSGWLEKLAFTGQYRRMMLTMASLSLFFATMFEACGGATTKTQRESLLAQKEALSAKIENQPTFTAPNVTNKKVRYTNLTWNSVEISWDAAEDKETDTELLIYNLFISQNSMGNGSSVLTSADDVSGELTDTLVFAVDKLKADTTYYFYVVVTDLDGQKNVYSELALTTAKRPTMVSPTHLNATGADQKVDLEWGAPAQNAVSGYLVVASSSQVVFEPENGQTYSVSSQIANASVIYNGSGTTFEHLNLSNDQSYHYAVFAYNDSLTYSSSVSSSATPSVPFGRLGLVPITNDVMSVSTYNGYAFAGTWGKTIERIDLSDFSFVDQLSPAGVGGNWFRDSYVDTATGMGYFVGDGWPTQIVKVNLDTFSYVDTLAMPNEVGKREGKALAAHNGFLYTAGSDWSGSLVSHHVMKVQLSDFSYVGALELDPGESYFQTLVVDPVDSMLYAVTAGTPAQIIKINLADFSRVGAISLGAAEGAIEHGCFLQQTERKLICATRTSPAYVVRIDLATFTRTDALETSQNSIVCSAYNPTTGMAYFGVNAAPAKVLKVDMSTFQEVGVTDAFEADENYTPDCTIDQSSGSVYVGVMGTNSGVVKVAP